MKNEQNEIPRHKKINFKNFQVFVKDSPGKFLTNYRPGVITLEVQNYGITQYMYNYLRAFTVT